jgi:hypothetical protein
MGNDPGFESQWAVAIPVYQICEMMLHRLRGLASPREDIPKQYTSLCRQIALGQHKGIYELLESAT